MRKRRTEEEIKKESKLASFVKTRRKNMELTQEELSIRIGVGIAFLKRLESGDTNLQYAKILQVLNYLGAEMVPKELSK